MPNSTTPGGPKASNVLDRAKARLDRWQDNARRLASRYPNAVRALAVAAVLFGVLSGWFGYQILAGLPGKEELREIAEVAEGTTIFDAHDRPIFSIPTQHRVEIELARMSPHLKNAVIAVEDTRFYDHDGIDSIRIIGAVLKDLRTGRAAEGASTITQQLARVSFLTRDKTLRRKIREAILAQQIERMYSKEEILEIYLNKVYFGDGLYGVEAAARGYFGKPASDLTVAEGAMLAGIIRAPSAANPRTNLERATQRRNVVLKLMRDNGFIEKAEHESAVAETVALHAELRSEDQTGLHFKEILRRQLIDKFGKDAVYQGRMRVYATIDPDMQKAAEAAVVSSLREIESPIGPPSRLRRSHVRASAMAGQAGAAHPPQQTEPLQGSLIALDPVSGEVRAIVGGRDTASVGLNRALQAKRQPGSAFKPFVYAAAIENGYSPATVIDRLNEPVDTYQGAWLPEDEHSNAPSMTIRTALRTSSNRAAVRMLETVGIERAVSYAKNLGVGAVPNVPSLALGSGEVTLASMTAAYGAFAHAGIVREPIFIRRVEDQDGTVLLENESRAHRAVSETTAFLMSTMLADVVDSGTANRARAMGFKRPAAGKTGTTNDFVDAWFVGYTPHLVAGVWIGYDTPRTIVKNGFAGLLAVPMWTRFMSVATKSDAPGWFDPPRDVLSVEVCRVSGQLPGEGCRNAASVGPTGEITYKSMVYLDYFVRGTEPRETCTAHAAQYLPYEEPTFAEAAFDGLAPFGMEAALPEPDPVPAAAQLPPESAPVSQRRIPDMPAAPLETRPEPAPVAAPSAPAAAGAPPVALPPAPPEAPPPGQVQ
ncbi:MAG TPA: PBP1A family penicillin-binding protein [Vicinamibacterales bacterium]|nr:PBP1A family penicillin-binding protein [Vicinamibacterales bacterium]